MIVIINSVKETIFFHKESVFVIVYVFRLSK